MSERDTMRWVWRGSALAALLIGWVFIAWQNRFHISAPVVFVCLGYMAVIATVYNLWRTGAAAVSSPEDEDDDSTWAKPAGALGELEREKRTLLKAIKEAEFDHEMRKLSKRDFDDMVRPYRARAIEVIKEIERIEQGAAGSTREQILREVRARLELEAKSPKKAAAEPKGAKPDSGDAKGKKKKPGKDAAVASEPAASEPAVAAAASEGADTRAAEPDGAAAKPTPASEASVMSEASEASEPVDGSGAAGAVDAAVAHPGDAANHTEPAPATKVAAQAAVQMDDDAMNADSTTAVEPKREDRAKEATP